jgi:uncharacterized RDD family membrane protein YckC
MTAREVAESYDGKIVVRRMKATGTDFIVLFVAIGIVGAVLKPKDTPAMLAVCALVSLAYYFVMEAVFARTVGKFLHGLVVVSDEGGKPSLAAVFLRTITRLVEVNPILFGALPAGLIANVSKSHQRLGDLLAGTFVILPADVPRITHSPSLGEVKPEHLSNGM